MFPNWNPAQSRWKPQHQSARCEAGYSGCVNEWYDPAAFVLAAPGQFGNVRRNSLYGPGIDQVNLSAAKTFALPLYNMKLQIRADAQNAFNHASFSLPTSTLIAPPNQQVGQPYSWYQTSTTNGVTTSTPSNQISGTSVGGRSVQLGAHLTF